MKKITSMKNRILSLSLCLFLVGNLFLIQSCSGPSLKDRNAAQAHSALLNADKNIAAFGHITVLDILNKMNYQSNPKTDVLIGGIVDQWKAGIDLSKPFYVSASALFAADGSPETIQIILDVKDAKKMDDVLAEMGYSMEKEGEMKYFQDNDVTFGMIHKLLVVIIKRNEYDGKKELVATIEKMSGDLSEGKTQNIIDSKADIVAGVNFERLFATSNTSLNNLNEAKKKELEETIADCFLQTSIQFETGQLSIENKHLFSDKFQNRLFFKDNNGNALVQKLKGKSCMAAAANLNVKNIESFMQDYLPEFYKSIMNQLPEEVGFGLMAIGENPFSQLFSGQFAYTVDGLPSEGKIPNYCAYVGFSNKGEIMGEFAKSSMNSTFNKNPLAPTITSTKKGMSICSKNCNDCSAFVAPSFAPQFGQNTASFFLDFKQINWDEYPLQDAQQVVKTFNYVTVEATKKGSKVLLKSKETNKNILKSMFDFYADMAMDKIGM